MTANFYSFRFLVLAFELTNILVRHKYVEAPYAFHTIYGLCTTFILALFDGQTSFNVKTLYNCEFREV